MSITKKTAVVVLLAAASLSACTTMLITKGASADGSMMVAHSDDSEMFDNRLAYVPAADHQPGDVRPVYYDPASLGNRPQYNANTLRRYVGTHRGPVYVDDSLPQSIPLGYIPQVAHTYAYLDGSYGLMNEHQLMMGEATNGSKVTLEPEPGKRIFYSAELSRVAMERCKTARCAVETMGKLIDEYGYYGTGEVLPIADTEEGWVFEMAPSPEGVKGLWVAKKVPDGEIFVAANEFRIRDIDPDDPDTLYSANLFEVAEKYGWWHPDQGTMDWLPTVSEGEYSHPYYSLRRVWRLQSRIAPSLNLSPWVKDGFTRDYPFTIKPDRKLSVEDVINLYRDHYQGTIFDQTKGATAGPFGNPYRYPGPMDSGNDTGKLTGHKGAWERPLSIYRSGYTYVAQARGWMPDAVGGLFWFAPDEAMSSVITPIYPGADNPVAKSYYTGFSDKFDMQSTWWAFNFVANWAALKYSYIIKDIKAKQRELETEAFAGVKTVEKQALEQYDSDPEGVKAMLGEFSRKTAQHVNDTWWALAWRLVAKYSDGYVNEPENMAQQVGYPDTWYRRSAWPYGPTRYEKPAHYAPGQ